MAQTKIEQGLLKFTEATDYLKIPTGTTAQRPSSPENGYIRFNTTINDVEAYDGTTWVRMAVTPPTFTSVDYPGSATALDPAGGEDLVINGTNFNAGITITIDGTTPSSITRNSSTQLTVTTPAKTAGTYDIVLTNTDGGTATATNAVSYNGIPAFTNAAGSLGSVEEDSAVNLSAAATEPDGGAITYAITSGALPTGLSLNSSTGAITGTAPSVSADTTSNFTVTATDNENQTASRAYSITVINVGPSQFFNTVLYTGNGSTQSITGVGFQPDFVWLKRRNGTQGHRLIDSSTGADKYLESNSNSQQQGAGGAGLTSFDSDGFSLGSGAAHNISGGTFVAWCWKLNGGTTSSNTDGTITSTVQVNNTFGFSIVEYTGNGNTSQQSFGHGLNSTPQLIIQKNIDTLTVGTNNWLLGGSAVGTAGQWLELNTTDALQTSTNYWGNQLPSSTVVYISGTSSLVHNQNAKRFINYCFVEKAGFSKFGTYTGNASANGPIVETGFEPAFVIIKRTDSADNWSMTDNKRATSNPRDESLFPNLNSSELTGGYSVNYLSNGFQIATSGAGVNANGGTFLYIAFAADPDTTSPTLADSFSTTTYTGNGSTQSITGLGFQPNLLWIKSRNQTYNHQLHDSLRGAGDALYSDLTSGGGNIGTVSSFDTNGFTVDGTTYAGTNGSGATFVSWAWKADGNLPTINTDGSVDSIVSANANAGFSIVKYTGSGVAGDTIGHGLSAAPELIIVKNRSITRDWSVVGSAIVSGSSGNDGTRRLVLNDTVVAYNDGFGLQSATSTTFAFEHNNSIANNTDDFIAYCFHSVSGFSKIGSYSGNNTGQTITTGFQPDFLMLKKTNVTSEWWIMDSVRGTTNNLEANTSDAENTGISGAPTFVSTGFNFSGSTFNETGTDWIYVAFKIN